VRVLNIILLIGILATPAWAAFDVVGWGPRALGMGGAFSTIADDASAIWWNPGASALARDPEFIASIAKPYLGLKLYRGEGETSLSENYIAALYPIKGWGSLGLSVAMFSAKDAYTETEIALNWGFIPEEIGEHFKKEEEFGAFGSGFAGSGLALGEQRQWLPPPEYMVGINLKYLSHNYILDEYASEDPVFASGKTGCGNFSLDSGVLIQFGDIFNVAIVGHNLVVPDLGLKSYDPVNPDFTLGVGTVRQKFSAGFDFVWRYSKYSAQHEMDVRAGAEWWPMANKVGLRCGVNFDSVTSGFSVRLKPFGNLVLGIDYAFLWPFGIIDSYGTHRIAISLSPLKRKITNEQKKTWS